MDGKAHDVGKWDLLIAHPPCTYLSNVATRSFSLRCTPPEKVVARWEDRAKGAVFFMQFLTANEERIAIENPVGFNMFAKSTDDTENYVTKATSLWLVNLPLLHGTGLPKPDNAAMFGVTPSGKARTWEDTFSRSAKVRSKTFPGIAAAMAEQWGSL